MDVIKKDGGKGENGRSDRRGKNAVNGRKKKVPRKRRKGREEGRRRKRQTFAGSKQSQVSLSQ